MSYYPINLNITGKPCLVIGGGAVAERKVESLVKAGAVVTVISPGLSLRLKEWRDDGKISCLEKEYQAGDAKGYFIVICATDNAQVNLAASAEAKAHGALVNVVDNPASGDFYVPAKIEHGDLLITVSTGGKSPELAKRLREELAEQYGPGYGIFLDKLAYIRKEMTLGPESSKDRERFWRAAVSKEVMDLLKQGKFKEAEERINNAVGSFGTQSQNGAG